MGRSVCMLKLCCCFRISCAICWPFLEHNSPECSDHTGMRGGAGDGFCVSEARVGPANRRLQQRRQKSSDQTPAQRTGRLEVRQCGAISRCWWGFFFSLGEGQPVLSKPGKVSNFPFLSQVCDFTTQLPLYLEWVLWYLEVAPLHSTRSEAFSKWPLASVVLWSQGAKMHRSFVWRRWCVQAVHHRQDGGTLLP